MRQSILKLLYVIVLFCATSDCLKYTEDPLFLTPYIETGKINEGRIKAVVEHADMKNVESYSGLITIDKKYNSNTFFWYIRSQNNSSKEPLLLWMNGGPGCSSLLGLFVENGPFLITDKLKLETRNYSWHQNHNIIYIDNPVGAGYSFTENELGYAKSADDVGRDVLNFLQQFFKLFPELRDNDLYITGESYAGKYVPALSLAIKKHNQGTEDKINLKGLAIGDGLTDPINQMKFSDLLFNVGMLDSSERDEWRTVENNIQSFINGKDYLKANLLLKELFHFDPDTETAMFEKQTHFERPYNFLQVALPDIFYYYMFWIEKPDVRKAIHVGGLRFNNMNYTVYNHFEGDIMQSVAHYVEELLEDYKVLLYNGQFDIIVPYAATQNYVSQLNWTGATEYKTAKKKPWSVKKNLAGYIKTVRNLNFVLVRNAGHFAIVDQPLRTWDLITRFTHNQNL